MAKWHGYGRCKTRLSKDIDKIIASRIQCVMTNHTISVAKSLEKTGFIETSLAISGLGLKNSRKWAKDLGIENFNLQGKGCLGERMKRQIIFNNKLFSHENFKNVIFIGTDLPNLCHLDILKAIEGLKQNDLILGPSNDGGYWLVALSKEILSKHLNLPFINIKWSKDNVLQSTINNFNKVKMKYKLLQKKNDIDTLFDIEYRNNQFA